MLLPNVNFFKMFYYGYDFDVFLFYCFLMMTKTNFFPSKKRINFLLSKKCTNFLFNRFTNLLLIKLGNFYSDRNFFLAKHHNYKFLKFYKVNRFNYNFFLVNYSFFFKSYKNIMNLLFGMYTRKRKTLFLSITDLCAEAKLLHHFMFGAEFYNYFNIFFKFKNIENLTRSKIYEFLSLFCRKNKVSGLILLEIKYSTFFIKLIQQIFIPKIGFQQLNISYDYFLEYPIFVNSYNILYKYFLFYAVCDIYFLSQKILQKKALLTFFTFFKFFKKQY